MAQTYSTSISQIADRLGVGREFLHMTLSLLDADELDNAALGTDHGEWSPKAMVAHIAFWDDWQRLRMMRAVDGTSATEPLVFPSDNNDARAAADAQRDFDDVLSAADTARQRLIDFTLGLDEAQLDKVYPEIRNGNPRELSLPKLLHHMDRHLRDHVWTIRHYASSLARWGRPDFRRFLVEQHENLMNSIAGLTEQTLVETELFPGWSIRDSLVHCAAWNECGWHIIDGWPMPDFESEPLKGYISRDGLDNVGLNNINEALLAERADWNMIDVADWLATYHRRTINLYDRSSDAELLQWGVNYWGGEMALTQVMFDYALHDAEHAAEIWAWRAAEDTSENGRDA